MFDEFSVETQCNKRFSTIDVQMEVFVYLSGDIGGLANILSRIGNLKKGENIQKISKISSKNTVKDADYAWNMCSVMFGTTTRCSSQNVYFPQAAFKSGHSFA